jgi:hypothetical protein
MLILLLTYNIGVNALEDKKLETEKQKLYIKDIGYHGENYTQLEGKGMTLPEIIEDYRQQFKDGYTLTVEDISNYLSCTPTYFLNTYRDDIKHIRVTHLIKEYLNVKKKDIDVGQDYKYFLKRILYNRESFREFVLDHAFVEQKYYRLYIKDFNITVPENAEKRFLLMARLKNTAQDLFKNFKEFKIVPIEYYPKKLYSQKDLLKHFEFKYEMDLYRKLENKGVNKIIFKGIKTNKQGKISDTILVRYDIDDFKLENDAYIVVNYAAINELGKEKVIKMIKNRL